jgi:hypothetical protein
VGQAPSNDKFPDLFSFSDSKEALGSVGQK